MVNQAFSKSEKVKVINYFKNHIQQLTNNDTIDMDYYILINNQSMIEFNLISSFHTEPFVNIKFIDDMFVCDIKHYSQEGYIYDISFKTEYINTLLCYLDFYISTEIERESEYNWH